MSEPNRFDPPAINGEVEFLIKLVDHHNELRKSGSAVLRKNEVKILHNLLDLLRGSDPNFLAEKIANSKRVHGSNQSATASARPKGSRCAELEEAIDVPLVFDIETTGLSTRTDSVTSIVWWYNGHWESWVQGEDISNFHSTWRTAKQVVGYNSRSFDEHALHHQFGFEFHPNHLDLLPHARRGKLSGGLKGIVARLGFARPASIDQVDGLLAVELWNYFSATGDNEAITALVYYNAWDVKLTIDLYNHMTSKKIDNSIPPFSVNELWIRQFIQDRPPAISNGKKNVPQRLCHVSSSIESTANKVSVPVHRDMPITDKPALSTYQEVSTIQHPAEAVITSAESVAVASSPLPSTTPAETTCWVKILKIEPRVFRTGVVTPMGQFHPPLATTSGLIATCQLPPWASLSRIGICAGDSLKLAAPSGSMRMRIAAYRKSDVAPELRHPVIPPTHCPSCQTPVVIDGHQLRCPSDSCPARSQ